MTINQINKYVYNNLLFKILIVSFLLIISGCKTSTNSTNSEDNSSQKYYVIATYNVRYKNDRDNKEGRSWEERRMYITNLVRKYNFDIFGVQEPFESQINDMAADLAGYRRFGVSDDDISKSTSNHHHDIFYKKHKFNLEDQGEFWLSPGAPTSPPDSLMTAAWGGKAKVCTWGKFRDKFTNDVFYVFNTHFYYKNETSRNNSATLILDKIDEIAGDSPAIFMGDLNFSQYSEGYGTLNNSTLLKDSYNWANSKFPINELAKHQTFNHWFLEPKVKATNKKRTIGDRIDHIFLTKHWQNKVKSHAVIWDNYSKDGILKMPSDHNPVMIKLEKLN